MEIVLPQVELPKITLPDFIIPEGWVLLVILFLFPFLIARKNKIDFEQVIQAYMLDSELLLIRFSLWLCRVKVFYTDRMKLSYRLKKSHYNASYKFHYTCGNLLYTVVRLLTRNR